MRRHLVVLLAIVAALAVALALAGCKRTPPAEQAEETASEEAHNHDHAAAEGETGQEEVDEKAAAVEQGRTLELMKTGSDAERVTAIEQIGNLRTADLRAEAGKLLRELIVDEETSPEVRAAALREWGAFGPGDYEPALGAAKSPHASVREAAARALASADLSTARPVLEALKNDPDSTVAAAAAESLADVLLRSKEDDTAIRALIDDLGHPEGDRSALAGMRLEQRGRCDHALVDRLTQALLASDKPAQRASLATVIGLASAGTNPGQEKFAGRVHVLSRGAARPSDAYTKPVPALMQVLGSDPDPMVREAAAESLGMIGAPEAAQALGKALSDPDAYVRRRAAAALIIVPPDDVRDELVHAATDDSSAAVRRFAVEAMANLDPAEAGNAVMLCLRDRDPEVRRYAAEVLGKIGTQKYTYALLPLFEDDSEDVRWKAVEAVAGFVDPDAKKALMAALEDSSPRVALAAQEGLHALGIGKRILTKAELGSRPRK
jgi:HEAT repeat protein